MYLYKSCVDSQSYVEFHLLMNGDDVFATQTEIEIFKAGSVVKCARLSGCRRPVDICPNLVVLQKNLPNLKLIVDEACAINLTKRMPCWKKGGYFGVGMKLIHACTERGSQNREVQA